eukprot:jgi/Ulvmu1/10169/UM006_0124.1
MHSTGIAADQRADSCTSTCLNSPVLRHRIALQPAALVVAPSIASPRDAVSDLLRMRNSTLPSARPGPCDIEGTGETYQGETWSGRIAGSDVMQWLTAKSTSMFAMVS